MAVQLKTIRGVVATTLCAMTFLAGCDPALTGADPAFKVIQRAPPITKVATVDYLIVNDRPLAEWISETGRKCDRFGCVK
tara:strand:+ start:1016 stop:1255 length:240 start_codon:yes stop_codon:yes gene_type:complete